MISLKTVDGDLMIKAVQEVALAPPDFTEIGALDEASKTAFGLASRYRNAGFHAMADKQNNIAHALSREKNQLQYDKQAFDWRSNGYFVIKEPKWDNKLELIFEDGILYLPYKIVSEKEVFNQHTDYHALYKVPIQNWVGDVPIQVLEATETFRSKFRELSIWFVARRSAVRNLVANFVRQDPILCGELSGGNYVVLKMWGDDLEDISLALIDPDLPEQPLEKYL